MFTSLVLLLSVAVPVRAQMGNIPVLGSVMGAIQGIGGGSDVKTGCEPTVPQKKGKGACQMPDDDDQWDTAAKAACAAGPPKPPPASPGGIPNGPLPDPTKAIDACHQADMFDKGSDAMNLAKWGYTMATAVCAVECGFSLVTSGGGSSTVCTVSSLGAMGFDIAGSLAVGEDIGDMLKQQAPLIAGQIFGMTQLNAFSSSKATDEAAKDAAKVDGNAKDISDADLNSEQGQKYTDERRSDNRKAACFMTLMNAVQAGIRLCNAPTVKLAAYNTRRQRLCLQGGQVFSKMNPYASTATGSGSGGAAAAVEADPSVKGYGDVAKPPALKPTNFAQSADTAGFGPLLNAFQNDTGQSPQGLLDNLNSGQSPLAALGNTLGDSISTDGGKLLGELATAAPQIEAAVGDKLAAIDRNSTLTQRTFEAVHNSGGGSGGHAGGGMPDLGALMAAMTPKKPEVEAPALQGASGPLTAKGKVSADGFHSPDKSLFDIVALRYQYLTNRFLAGEAIIDANRAPASLVPVNPYLKK